jgi:hypothetical protein
MRVIRLFYEPSKVLVELRTASWVPAFAACLVLSWLTNLVILKAIGVDTVLARVPARMASELGHFGTLSALYAGRTVQMIAGLLVFTVALWLALRILDTGIHIACDATFSLMFTVSCYAAYVREAAKLFVSAAVVCWHRLTSTRMVEGHEVRTNLAALLDSVPSGRLFVLARSVDALTFLFLVLIAAGLPKVIPGLSLRRAAAVVLIAWLLYVALAVVWGR